MLKFARHSRSSSMDRTSVSSISPLSSPRPRSSSSERTLETSEENKRTMSPPPPIPCRQTVNNKTNSDDYEAISTLGLLTRNVAMAPMTPTLQKLATTVASISPKSVLKRRYDFHKAVEKLVQEKFVPNHTSSPVIQPLDTFIRVWIWKWPRFIKSTTATTSSTPTWFKNQ